MIAVMLLTGAALAETVASHLGFEALRLLYDGEQNQVVSPVSLAYALAMAAEGAEGETRQEILDALGAESADEVAALQEALTDAGLRQANAAFLTGEMVPKDEYAAALEEKFGAKWFPPEVSNVESINKWVEDVTDGMIPEIIGELPEEVQLVLLNAIAMDANWQIPFDEAGTYEETFFSPGGEVAVEMMHNTFHADCGEREGVQLLRLNYRDCGLTMLIALPEEGGIEGVLDGLCKDGLDYFTFGEEKVKVKLSMPKMDIDAANGLKETLRALGVETLFSDGANLSGITADMPLKVGSVLQKARLILDEEGTRAAAVTAIMVETCAAPVPEEIVEFNLNRPFVAVIADEESGAVCFAGIVTNPDGN